MDSTPVLRADRITRAGFSHGFSTRVGGTSGGLFASMNLGRAVGDTGENLAENHRRLALAIGYDVARLFEASQVHGNAVVTLRGEERPEQVRPQHADALVTARPGFAVGVRTADCVPVLLADPVTGGVAAVHAGWRGVEAEVVRAAVHALEGSQPNNVLAAIGPSIGPCCFEVDDEVAARLAHVAGDGIVIRRGREKPHVDLWRAVEHQLHSAGVTTVDTLGHCTVCDAERFFSYRRDGAKSGRMLSAILSRAA